ncbi:hypothetical protein B0H63DRAFT_63230 [Podospora didyma]|uniref:Uncharacterized protein n=1 Tax=Podospora didyma TaxID=330526 RepID=A0AAE0P7Z0_9PEZI|nr:hypothetical protein B0H63DRAFT_63230 [Podospora didyma]
MTHAQEHGGGSGGAGHPPRPSTGSSASSFVYVDKHIMDETVRVEDFEWDPNTAALVPADPVLCGDLDELKAHLAKPSLPAFRRIHAFNAPWAVGLEPAASVEKRPFAAPAKDVPIARTWRPTSHVWEARYHVPESKTTSPDPDHGYSGFRGPYHEFKIAFDVVSADSKSAGPPPPPPNYCLHEVPFYTKSENGKEPNYSICFRRYSALLKVGVQGLEQREPAAVLWVFENSFDPSSRLFFKPVVVEHDTQFWFKTNMPKDCLPNRIVDATQPRFFELIRQSMNELIELIPTSWQTLAVYASSHVQSLVGGVHLRPPRRRLMFARALEML